MLRMKIYLFCFLNLFKYNNLDQFIYLLPKDSWDAEQIGREMRGEGNPQPTFDEEFQAMKKIRRADYPVPTGAQPN